MGIKRILPSKTSGMSTVHRAKMNQQMENIQTELLKPLFDEAEMYNAQTPMASDDLWKKFELPTPPRSPSHDTMDCLDLENISMPFDIDTEDLLLLQDTDYEMLRDIEEISFPESPPGLNPNTETLTNLQSNLIQDIMWSAPAKVDTSSKVTQNEKQRIRCNSCSAPTNTACVAPDEVLMETNIGGALSQTKIHNLGIDTPSDSEEEIDVVTVEKKQLQMAFPSKRKYRSDDESTPEHVHRNKTVTLTIEPRVGNVQTLTKCTSVRQRVDCPTDVHNYSLPVTSLKRVHSYPSSPVTHRSKKLKRDISIPSELKKVAQKLKSSVNSCSRNSSDSEEFNEVGKRTQHNVLERKRRTDLKNSFFHLRDSVPELEGQERAPKVVILRKASQYIQRLIEEQRRQERDLELLQQRKEKLKRQLAKLREY